MSRTRAIRQRIWKELKSGLVLIKGMSVPPSGMYISPGRSFYSVSHDFKAAYALLSDKACSYPGFDSYRIVIIRSYVHYRPQVFRLEGSYYVGGYTTSC